MQTEKSFAEGATAPARASRGDVHAARYGAREGFPWPVSADDTLIHNAGRERVTRPFLTSVATGAGPWK